MSEIKNKKIMMSSIILILLLMLLSGCVSNSTDSNYENNFSFTNVNGQTAELKDYRGKVVIVDFWATWCGPCQFQMTELKKVYENYSRDDLEIISLNIESTDSNTVILSFIQAFDEQLGIELDWIFGNDDGPVWEEYHLTQGGIPTIYIFDQEGKIHFSEESVTFYDEVPDSWSDDLGDPIRLKPKIDELL